MAENDVFQRLLDAGATFTKLTRERAERIVNQMVKAGEVRQERAQKVVDDLMSRSRKNSEDFMDNVRKEVQRQVKALGIATQQDISRLERKIARGGGAKKSAKKKAPAKKAKAAGATKAAGSTEKA